MTIPARDTAALSRAAAGRKAPKLLKSFSGNLAEFRTRKRTRSGLEAETGWLDEYCRAHPSENHVVATDQLVKTLIER
jgi:hypothetical protein